MTRARPGENVKIKLKGVNEEHLHRGFVLCPVAHPCPAVTRFEAQLALLQLLDHRPIMSPGYTCVLHAHTAQEECEVVSIVSLQERSKDGKVKTRKRPGFAKSNAVIVARIQVERRTPLAPFSRMPQLGRFTLRDEGRTIAIGKITRVPEAKSSSGGGGGGSSA